MMKFLISLFSVCMIISCNNKSGEQKKTGEDTKVKADTGNKVNTENTRQEETKLNPDNTISTSTIHENEPGWTTADENTFLGPCIKNASKNVGQTRANEYCNCMLQKIKIKYKSYQEAERQFQTSEEAINRMADECNSQ